MWKRVKNVLYRNVTANIYQILYNNSITALVTDNILEAIEKLWKA